jgi:hypothetical protein
MADDAPQMNPRKVRMGLAVVVAVVVVAIVLFAVVNDPLGRAVFVGVAVVALVRAIGLYRWLRQNPPGTVGS